jgi:hypothetical protein
MNGEKKRFADEGASKAAEEKIKRAVQAIVNGDQELLGREIAQAKRELEKINGGDARVDKMLRCYLEQKIARNMRRLKGGSKNGESD